MTLLTDIDFALEYRHGHSDLVANLFVPALSASTEYDRAAGYFSSYSLSIVAGGLPSLIARNGTMRLIAGPVMSADDIDALGRGVRASDDVVEKALLAAFARADEDVIVRERLGFLAWMVATQTLTIKIALPSIQTGIYHEKYGIFRDEEGNAVAFTGSSNETRGGLSTNFESLDVYTSWGPDAPRVLLKQAAFQRSWDGLEPGLNVVPLPEAVMRQLLKLRPESRPDPDPTPKRNRTGAPSPAAGHGPEDREYQQDAIRAWIAADRRGVLAMATGTGKTITALIAASDYLGTEDRSVVVVVAPFKHLVDQWAKEARQFGLKPIVCYDDSDLWLDRLESAAGDMKLGIAASTVVVITQAGMSSDKFRTWFSRSGARSSLIIGDEVHNLGSGSAIRSLDRLDFTFRLGLSATPTRWSDEETDALYRYFGPVVYEFSLERAIKEGFLVPYDYRPHLVEMTHEEFARYSLVSQKIARLLAITKTDGLTDPEMAEPIAKLLRDRAAILNGAEGKQPMLAHLLDGYQKLTHALVYTSPSALKETIATVSDGGRRLVHRFTFRESARERRELLAAFSTGEIGMLVAIRCLDEGVDVPSTETAFIMASSSNSREFVQRRGRILRRSIGKAKATIHDFIAIPPSEVGDPSAWRYERAALRRELSRFREFAGLALNRLEAEAVIIETQRRYALLDL